MKPEQVLARCNDAADAIAGALGGLSDWGEAGTRHGQYRSDLAADAAAVVVLGDAGFGILSEESGLHWPERELIAVVDPVDGSTNASRGLPWYAASICVLDAAGPLVATVTNLSTGTRYEAIRGGGARRDGVPITPNPTQRINEAILALSGYPPRHLGWRQYRCFGAAALDLCAVANGTFDGYVDCVGGHGVWDYLAALLVCREAGASIEDFRGRDLVLRDHELRRQPVAAANDALLGEIYAAMRREQTH